MLDFTDLILLIAPIPLAPVLVGCAAAVIRRGRPSSSAERRFETGETRVDLAPRSRSSQAA